MKKITIGIPRAFLFYRYGVLWKTFFEHLGCKVILSSKTNNKIIKIGNEFAPSECCLSYKIYIGHALSLKDKCDYLFIPQICNYGEKSRVCYKHSLAYENIKMIISKKELLTYCIEHTNHKYQILGLLKIALKITKNPLKIIYSYSIATKKQYNYNISKQNENKNKLTKENKKVLIVSPFYILQDEYFINDIIKILEKNNLIPIFANHLDSKIATTFSLYYKYVIPWKYYQELVGAIYYYKYQVDGIIFITPNQCEIASILNTQIINENINIPVLNITISDISSKIDIDNNLEAYIDIINKKEF